MKYKISKEFTETPGGRFYTDGDFSGEMFREEVLKSLLETAISSNEKIIIDLDDTYGYGSSFLEEAFGGLARIKTTKIVKEIIDFKSNDEPEQIERLKKYIEDASK